MAVYREPEHCSSCGKQLVERHRKIKDFVGDTFIGYKLCECRNLPLTSPATDLLPNLDKSTENLSKIKDKDEWLNEVRGATVDPPVKNWEWEQFERIMESTVLIDKKRIIEYIYEFAWNYGRYYHIGHADKIIERVKEVMQLPEEFLNNNPVAPPVSGDEKDGLLSESNSIIRSFYSVIERKGQSTNWDALEKQVSRILKEQRDAGVIHPLSIKHTEMKQTEIQPPVSIKEVEEVAKIVDYCISKLDTELLKSRQEFHRLVAIKECIKSYPTPIKETVTDGVEFAEWKDENYIQHPNGYYSKFNDGSFGKSHLSPKFHTLTELYTLFQKSKTL